MVVADCKANVKKMQNSNFCHFYYNYLKTLHEGKFRSQAFFEAQQAYSTALIADSVNGIHKEDRNYQFSLCNLLAYHNFGVLEPNAAAMALCDTKLRMQCRAFPRIPCLRAGAAPITLRSRTENLWAL